MRFFDNLQGFKVCVIHIAGSIDISEQISPTLYDVNVNGTKNMIALCKEYTMHRMINVSSVHAIPENMML